MYNTFYHLHVFFIICYFLTFSSSLYLSSQALFAGALSEINFWILAEDDTSHAQLLDLLRNSSTATARPNIAVFRLVPFVREADCPLYFANFNLTHFFKASLNCRLENIPVSWKPYVGLHNKHVNIN